MSNGVGRLEGLFMTEGYIKLFDHKGNYGFIVPNDELPEIHFVGKNLRDALARINKPFDTPISRARVRATFRVVREGLRAEEFTITNLQSVCETRKVVEPIVDYTEAVVVEFFDKRGYGFFNAVGVDEDIFFYMSMLEAIGLNRDDVFEGLKLLVRYGEGPKGLLATHVRRM